MLKTFCEGLCFVEQHTLNVKYKWHFLCSLIPFVFKIQGSRNAINAMSPDQGLHFFVCLFQIGLLSVFGIKIMRKDSAPSPEF